MVGGLMETVGRPLRAKVLKDVQSHPDSIAGLNHPLRRQGRELQHAAKQVCEFCIKVRQAHAPRSALDL